MQHEIIDQISALFNQAGLSRQETKSILRQVVASHWGPLPPWSTLKYVPVIEEVQKCTFAPGGVMVFEERGEHFVVLAEAGVHYEGRTKGVACYMIPGGFANLSYTEGSSKVAASEYPEMPRYTVAREMEEELRDDRGSPLLSIDPARLTPLDMLTLDKPEIRVVASFLMELNDDEVRVVKAHVHRLGIDAAYKSKVVLHSENKDSKKPEIADVKIFSLDDVVAGACKLLNADQHSLFVALQNFYKQYLRIDRPRTAPTRSFKEKVKSLADLQAEVDALRIDGAKRIGVASGAFDILHPGHISLLEDARARCDHLIVIVASDRTVREQKGEGKPVITETKRAQTLAALLPVDAVIISDEFYHENILHALHPDVFFKGDDYIGKQIMGAGLVGEVVFIPCADKVFNSSSALVRTIQATTLEPEV